MWIVVEVWARMTDTIRKAIMDVATDAVVSVDLYP